MRRGIRAVVRVFGLYGWLLLIVPANLPAAQPLSVTSPDGRLTLTFELKENPQPYLPGVRAYYRVSYQGDPVLTHSPLGLDFKGQPALDHDFEITGSHQDSHNSTWTNEFGADRAVRDHYNELIVSLRERQSPGRRMDLIFRAYNAGIALRYSLPRQDARSDRAVRDHYNELIVSLRERQSPGRRMDLIFRAYNAGIALRYSLPRQDALGEFTLSSEDTGFFFPGNPSAFALDLGSYTTSYESEFQPITLDQIKPASIIGIPLLVH